MIKFRWWGAVCALALTPILLFQNCQGFKMLDPVNADNFAAAPQGEDRDPFTEHPASQLVEFQSATELRADFRAAEGAAPVFQWHFKPVAGGGFRAVEGATAATLAIADFNFEDQGDYYVIATVDGVAHESRHASVKIRGQTNTCQVEDLPKLGWPLKSGTPHAVTNYYDRDEAQPAIKDYMNAIGDDAQTYDQHRGVDIAIGNFKIQDQGVDIVAVAPGIVELTADGNPDRNTALMEGAKANLVVVRSPNGFATGYLHMRKGSVKVKPGDVVKAGDVLGQVGSSGYSNGPHVHLETRDCKGVAIDHMVANLFASPPAYAQTAILFDFHIQAQAITSVALAADPVGTSLGQGKAGTTYYTVASFGGVGRGDSLRMDFIRPNGQKGFDLKHTVAGRKTYGSYRWWTNYYLGDTGTWKIRLYRNDVLVAERNFAISN